MRPELRRRILLAATLFAAATTALLLLPKRNRTPTRALDDLADSVHASGRPFQARLTGFSWSGVRASNRSASSDLRSLRMRLNAASVAERMKGDATAAGQHTRGVAELLSSAPAAAIPLLAAATSATPERAEAWNDLAAAYLVSANDGAVADFGSALAAADRALRNDPRMSEALFNRALILENLGLRAQSETAWRRALAAETEAAWRAEAQQHLTAMASREAVQFKAAFARLERAALAGDAVEVRNIVMRFAQQTRATAEVETLGAWADAVVGKEDLIAAGKLRVAREIGEALWSTTGEALLRDAVAVIDRQQASAARLRELADAHRSYRQARIAYSRKLVSESEPLFHASASAFAKAESPMALVARYYAANTAFDQARITTALDMLTSLASDSRLDHYRALEAQVQWELSLCKGARGQWAEALTAAQRGAMLFRQLGERGNLGFLENMIAETYDRVSDHDEAWRHRLEALRLLGQEAGNRLPVTLAAAVYGELRAGRAEVGLSLLELVIEESPRASSPWLLSEVYVWQSMLHARLGDADAARRDIVEARLAAAAAQDPAIRRQALAYASLGEATLIRASEPRRAIALLDSVSSFYESVENRLNLPAVRYERGRAHRLLGESDAAWRDIASGVAEVEAQRATIGEASLRAVMFDDSAELFDEAVDLLLSRGDSRGAFEYVERSRARILVEELSLRGGSDAARTLAPAPLKAADVQAALPPGATLVEFAVLRDRFAQFIVTNRDFQVVQTPVGRQELAREVEAFRRALTAYAPAAAVAQHGQRLYDLLVRPAVTAHPGSILTFVPDRTLQVVPWAALTDRNTGRFLIETMESGVVPSASCLLHGSQPPPDASQPSILVIGNPSVNRMESLPAAEEEAKIIGRTYARSTVLLGANATRAAFLSNAGAHEMVHFAGHAAADVLNRGTNALLLADSAQPSRLTAGEIASLRLPRTRLVVLAACGTMFESRRHIDWTPTLAHAFLAAGVPSVVGTLWPIGDQPSAILFRHFHATYAADHDAAQALRTAQLRMLSETDPQLRHPASWAGAQLISLGSIGRSGRH